MTTEPAASGGAFVACRCCGSALVTLRGTKRSRFLGRDFDFWHCPACDFMFVEPFSGTALYNESEYRDYRTTDRMVEFDDLWRVATGFVADRLPEGAIEWLDFGCGAGGLL